MPLRDVQVDPENELITSDKQNARFCITAEERLDKGFIPSSCGFLRKPVKKPLVSGFISFNFSLDLTRIQL
jgi:hypothetical protein